MRRLCRMFFGGYDEDDDDDIQQMSSQTDEVETFEDVVPELDLGEPPDDVKAFARQHISESPDTRSSVLQEFRDMIYERGEIVPHRMDDAFLIRFLRARRFLVEKAHKLMVNYYGFKENNPEIHESLNPLNMRHIGDDNVLSVLPYREQTGRRIMIYKLGNWNPSSYSIEELFKATVVILELAVMEQRAQILGGICIFDLGGISLQHAWQITPAIAKRTVELMVIHFHGQDLESLHSQIDPKFLPKAYGGMRPEYSYTDWVDRFVNNKDIMAEMTQQGFVFDLDEVKKVIEDAKIEISSNKNVKMTREVSSERRDTSTAENNID